MSAIDIFLFGSKVSRTSPPFILKNKYFIFLSRIKTHAHNSVNALEMRVYLKKKEQYELV